MPPSLAAPALALALACSGKPGDGATPTTPTPTEPTTQTEPTEPTEPTSPWGLERCPGPPADAATFETGTVHVDRVFVEDEPDDSAFGSRFSIVINGVSYIYETAACYEEIEYWSSSSRELLPITEPIRQGERVGDYFFKLAFSAPTATVSELLGTFPDQGGHLYNKKFPDHQLMIGWHDGEAYRMVYSLPDGLTRTTVCIDQFTRTRLVLTGLFEPLDGPYTTNHHTTLTHPIWFKVDAWATHAGPDKTTIHRSCMLNAVDGEDEPTVEWLDTIFAE